MVEEMTPKKRLFSALVGGRVDRHPVIGLSSYCIELMDYAKVDWPDIQLSSKAMAKLWGVRYDYWGLENICVYNDSNYTTEALGAKGHLGSKDTHHSLARPAVFQEKDPDDVSIPEDYLERGRLPAMLDACEIVREKYPDVPICTAINEGFEGAGDLFGYERVLAWAKQDPDKFHAAINFSIDIGIKTINGFKERGADVWIIADAGAADLLSAELYDKYMVDVYKKLIKKTKMFNFQHLCGEWYHIAHILPKIGFNGLSWDTPFGSVDFAKSALGDKIALIGGVAVLENFFQGTPQTIREEAFDSLSKGIDILAPGCGCPPRTKTENVRALVQAAKDFKRDESVKSKLKELMQGIKLGLQGD